jgi:predicted esterase
MPTRLPLAAYLAICCVAGAALGQPATRPASAPVQRGAFHISFTEQSALSPIQAQYKRHRIKVEEMQRYTLSEESFEAFVPVDYDPSQKYGLLVWASASGRGTLPKGWPELLAKHKLIAIGANNAGNQRGVGVRMGLALDAVHNLKEVYSIDDNRVYVSGMSGGGKVATMLAIIYPEVFRGAIPIVGVAFYRDIPVPGEAKKVYPRNFDRPPLPMFDRARANRFVLITGSNDFNRDPTQATFEQGFKKEKFQNVEYIEVPGLGHTIPEVDVIERAIQFLDARPAAPTGSNRAGRPSAATRASPRP